MSYICSIFGPSTILVTTTRKTVVEVKIPYFNFTPSSNLEKLGTLNRTLHTKFHTDVFLFFLIKVLLGGKQFLFLETKSC